MIKIYYGNINKIKTLELEKFPKQIQEYLQKKNIQSLKAWSLLIEKLLIEHKKEELEFTFNELGKPFCNKKFISLAHSKNMIVVAISDSNIGIDVEFINEQKDLSKLISKLLSNNTNINNRQFYEFFTKKEAKIKYLGLGLGNPKNALNKDIDDVNSISLFDELDEYILSYKSLENTIIMEKIV